METHSFAVFITSVINPFGSSLSYHPLCGEPNTEAASELMKQAAPVCGSGCWYSVVCPIKLLVWSLAHLTPGSAHPSPVIPSPSLHMDTHLELRKFNTICVGGLAQWGQRMIPDTANLPV